MSQTEDHLDQAERQVREGEARVEWQKWLLQRLEFEGHFEAAETARELLATLNKALETARQHLELERQEAEAVKVQD